MAYITDGSCAGKLAALGNIDGDHQGDCLLYLPDGRSLRVGSGDLTVHAEGFAGRLADGRKFFAHTSGVLLIDAPDGSGDVASDG